MLRTTIALFILISSPALAFDTHRDCIRELTALQNADERARLSVIRHRLAFFRLSDDAMYDEASKALEQIESAYTTYADTFADYCEDLRQSD